MKFIHSVPRTPTAVSCPLTVDAHWWYPQDIQCVPVAPKSRIISYEQLSGAERARVDNIESEQQARQWPEGFLETWAAMPLHVPVHPELDLSMRLAARAEIARRELLS